MSITSEIVALRDVPDPPSFTEIARKLGITKGQAIGRWHRWRLAHGVAPSRPAFKLTEDDVAAIKAAPRNITRDELAARYGVHIRHIDWVRRT